MYLHQTQNTFTSVCKSCFFIYYFKSTLIRVCVDKTIWIRNRILVYLTTCTTYLWQKYYVVAGARTVRCWGTWFNQFIEKIRFKRTILSRLGSRSFIAANQRCLVPVVVGMDGPHDMCLWFRWFTSDVLTVLLNTFQRLFLRKDGVLL